MLYVLIIRQGFQHIGFVGLEKPDVAFFLPANRSGFFGIIMILPGGPAQNFSVFSYFDFFNQGFSGFQFRHKFIAG